MNSITATLGSLAYDNLVPGDDYKMYHCKKHDNRFGTKYIRPQTREQHSNREYLGAPYKYADDWENSFESGRPADWSPSPELEHGRRVFWGGSPSEDRDSELDYENPLGQWYWQQREKEEVSAQPTSTQMTKLTHHSSAKMPSSRNDNEQNYAQSARTLDTTVYPSHHHDCHKDPTIRFGVSTY